MAGGEEQEGILAGALRRTALWLIGLTIALWFVTAEQNLTFIFFREQDVPVLAAGLLLLLAGALWSDRMLRWAPAWTPPAWLAAPLILIIAVAGTWLVFGDYALSRDELLADFDADYLRQGLAIAPVPAEWRPFAAAMMPIFMLPVPPEIGWMSAYLPGNAALRAGFDLVIGREWTNPVLAALACLALWRVAQRLWPGSSGAAALPVLLMAASPQLLAMAMTPYAMTAHLACNLIWLACHLRGDRRGDAGALAAGFVATGLHQLVFHPIFAAPFILELLLARRWGRAGLYILGYAAIGLFWASYWQFVVPAGATGGGSGHGLLYLLSRIGELIFSFNLLSPVLMLLNLLRFVAWTHLLLVPLALLAWPLIRRGDGVARPLALGIVLMLALLLVLLPWQGHGWGYRYLHGFLGSFALLATYGWQRLTAQADRRRRGPALALATGATLLVLLPFQLWAAAQFVRPYREAQARIASAPVDVVIVDPTATLFAADLVRSRPDVSDRPVVMDLLYLEEPQLRALCARYRVAVFDHRDAAAAGIRLVDTPQVGARRRVLDGLGCAVPLSRPAPSASPSPAGSGR